MKFDAEFIEQRMKAHRAWQDSKLERMCQELTETTFKPMTDPGRKSWIRWACAVGKHQQCASPDCGCKCHVEEMGELE